MLQQLQAVFPGTKKYKSLLGIILSAGTVLFLWAGFALPVKALTLTPPMTELSGDPGAELTSKVKVLNESKDSITLYTSTANFTAKDETGNPEFLFGEKGDLADWINVNPGPITLMPGERQEIAFTVKVPKDAPAGGHYAGIFFSSNPPKAEDGQSNISVVSKLGTLLILRVSGNVTVKSALQEFHVLNNQHWFTRLPIQFWYRLGNAGNVHIRPTGTVEIKNMLGRVASSVTANPTDGAVLPNTIRRFDPVWQNSALDASAKGNFLQRFFAEAKAEIKNFAFGRYTATLSFANVPEAGHSTLSFWVFPWQLLLITLVVLLLVWFLLKMIIRRYNSWILQKYANNKK